MLSITEQPAGPREGTNRTLDEKEQPAKCFISTSNCVTDWYINEQETDKKLNLNTLQ